MPRFVNPDEGATTHSLFASPQPHTLTWQPLPDDQSLALSSDVIRVDRSRGLGSRQLGLGRAAQLQCTLGYGRHTGHDYLRSCRYVTHKRSGDGGHHLYGGANTERSAGSPAYLIWRRQLRDDRRTLCILCPWRLTHCERLERLGASSRPFSMRSRKSTKLAHPSMVIVSLTILQKEVENAEGV
jgi:hypothetical protein